MLDKAEVSTDLVCESKAMVIVQVRETAGRSSGISHEKLPVIKMMNNTFKNYLIIYKKKTT